MIPTGQNVPGQTFIPCYIGTGARFKRVQDELVVRGQVLAEALAPATDSPHTVSLANRSNRVPSQTKVYKTLNGIKTGLASQFVAFSPAKVTSSTTSNADLSASNAFGLELDGKVPVTIRLLSRTAGILSSKTYTQVYNSGSGVAPTFQPAAATTLAFNFSSGYDGGNITIHGLADDAATSEVITVVANSTVTSTKSWLHITSFTSASVGTTGTLTVGVTAQKVLDGGAQIDVFRNFGDISAVTPTEIRDALNAAFAGSALFGTSYASAASLVSSAVTITSQRSDLLSDVRVFAAHTASAKTAIWGSAADAATIITIDDRAWTAGASWTVDYVALGQTSDALDNSDVTNVVRVGSQRGSARYIQGTDFALGTDAIDWESTSAASVTYTPTSTTPDLSSLTDIVLAIDGKSEITVPVMGADSFFLGYANDATPSSVTLSNIVGNINAALAASSVYGARYGAVATTDGSTLTFTSVLEGTSGSVRIKSAASASLTATLTGLTTDQLGSNGVITYGTVKVPADGATYFVTYDYTKPASEYNVPVLSTSKDEALAQVGEPSVLVAGYCPLGIMADLAFKAGPTFIYTIQVDDASAEGNPTRVEVQEALDAAKVLSTITEICVIGEPGTRLDTMTDVVEHLEDQNGLSEQHFRRGFFGAARGTAVGAVGTSGSLMDISASTLQVGPESPARGRMFHVIPAQEAGLTYDVKLAEGNVATVELDNTYLAGQAAARRCALNSPSDTLTRKRMAQGFNTRDVTSPWTPAQRKLLAGTGGFVVSFDTGGFFVCLDAQTTEGGGAGEDKFRIDSTSYQKDVITVKVNRAIDDALVGVVPFDIANFITDIKTVIQNVINGEIFKQTIGPYRQADNITPRALDPRRDIRVVPVVGSKTAFKFQYFYFLRYPALYFDGEYSVDEPFASLITG